MESPAPTTLAILYVMCRGTESPLSLYERGNEVSANETKRVNNKTRERVHTPQLLGCLLGSLMASPDPTTLAILSLMASPAPTTLAILYAMCRATAPPEAAARQDNQATTFIVASQRGECK